MPPLNTVLIWLWSPILSGLLPFSWVPLLDPSPFIGLSVLEHPWAQSLNTVRFYGQVQGPSFSTLDLTTIDPIGSQPRLTLAVAGDIFGCHDWGQVPLTSNG